MAIGMPYKLYWTASPHLVIDFRKAHRFKTQQRNEELWLQGLYFYDALSVALSNAFGKKGSKRQKYYEKPIDILPKTKEEKVEEAEEAKAKVIAQLNAWKAAWDKKHKGGALNGNRNP